MISYLTDMDGVLVRENHEIPGASNLIERWVDTSHRFLVLTNNSIFTPRDLSARLQMSGLTIPEEFGGAGAEGVHTVAQTAHASASLSDAASSAGA